DNFRRDAFQVARRRVARGAAAGERGLARFRVADQDARRLHARLVVAGRAERVEKRRDVPDLFRREGEFRHAAIGASVLNDRRDRLPMLVVEHETGSQEARPAVSAASVGAVAELAVDAVESLAARDGLGILRRTIGVRVARRRHRRAASASAAGLRLAGRRRRRLSAPHRGGQRRHACPFHGSLVCNRLRRLTEAEKRGNAFRYDGSSVATIYEVAKRAGVSTATVSRVLSQPDVVSPATRRRVLDAVERLGYTPNAAAKNLRTLR